MKQIYDDWVCLRNKIEELAIFTDGLMFFSFEHRAISQKY
jgi:hypothetical protein